MNLGKVMNRRCIVLGLFYAAIRASAATCDGAVGEWKWFNGGSVTFTSQNVVLMNGKAEGQWSCSDPARALITVRWKGGFVDNLTVSANRMTGKNQQGVLVSADRKPAAPHK